MSYFKVSAGSDLGRPFIASTYAPPWNPGEPNNSGYDERVLFMYTSGKWNDAGQLYPLAHLCEFGGTMESTSMFRGMTIVKVRSTPCGTYGGLSRAYKGACHELNVMQTVSSGAAPTRASALFASHVVPDLLSVEALNIGQAVVSMTPPLCTPLSVATPGGLTVATVAGSLTLSGAGAIGLYVTALRSTSFTTCPRGTTMSETIAF
eukprot:PhM_4_TR17449/c2_g1_i4/m.88741